MRSGRAPISLARRVSANAETASAGPDTTHEPGPFTVATDTPSVSSSRVAVSSELHREHRAGRHRLHQPATRRHDAQRVGQARTRRPWSRPRTRRCCVRASRPAARPTTPTTGPMRSSTTNSAGWRDRGLAQPLVGRLVVGEQQRPGGRNPVHRAAVRSTRRPRPGRPAPMRYSSRPCPRTARPARRTSARPRRTPARGAGDHPLRVEERLASRRRRRSPRTAMPVCLLRRPTRSVWATSTRSASCLGSARCPDRRCADVVSAVAVLADSSDQLHGPVLTLLRGRLRGLLEDHVTRWCRPCRTS